MCNHVKSLAQTTVGIVWKRKSLYPWTVFLIRQASDRHWISCHRHMCFLIDSWKKKKKKNLYKSVGILIMLPKPGEDFGVYLFSFFKIHPSPPLIACNVGNLPGRPGALIQGETSKLRQGASHLHKELHHIVVPHHYMDYPLQPDMVPR